jgi:hypothetical protein
VCVSVCTLGVFCRGGVHVACVRCWLSEAEIPSRRDNALVVDCLVSEA